MKLHTRRAPSYHAKRTRETIAFCDIPRYSTVLDIGEPNYLAIQMGREKRVTVINTTSDLDYEIKPEGVYDYVTCFEVIEHLLNPRTFFDNLHGVTKKLSRVFLSYPSRPKWFWNDAEHFHEYDRMRFEYLLDKTGWEIVREKPIYVRRWPTGIRPLLRNFMPQTTVYELRKKL